MPPSSMTDTASPSRCYTIRRLHGVISQKNVSSIPVFLNRRAAARYRAARSSPGICHFNFLRIFHE